MAIFYSVPLSVDSFYIVPCLASFSDVSFRLLSSDVASLSATISDQAHAHANSPFAIPKRPNRREKENERYYDVKYEDRVPTWLEN